MRSVIPIVVCLVAGPQSAAAQPPATATADDAARAAFEHALSFHDFDSFELGVASRPGDGVGALFRSIDDAARRMARALERLDAVLAHRSPRWTIAALVERGRIHETYARGLREPPVAALPLQAAELEAARRALARHAADAQCRATAEYLRAVRLARSARLETPETRVARDRLRAQDARRVRDCIEEIRSGDRSLARFHADELDPESGRN